MIQTRQKTFGIRVTDAESRAEPRPKCGRIMRARRARLPQIRHRKMRLVRRRDAAHFAESAANGFGARLFDAQIIVGNRVLFRHERMLGLRKALRQIATNTLPRAVRIGENNNSAPPVRRFNIRKCFRAQAKSVCRNDFRIYRLTHAGNIRFSFDNNDFFDFHNKSVA